MTISRAEAADALREAEQASHRSRVHRGYRSAAPHFVLWGILYALGYGAAYARVADGGTIWLVLVPLGISIDVLLVRRDGRGTRPVFYILGLVALLTGFIVAALAIIRPTDPVQGEAFGALVLAVAYTALGIFLGWRWIATGVAFGALVLIGFFLMPSIFTLWLAGVGGATLVAGGLWLGRA